jgi:hypothetical protein
LWKTNAGFFISVRPSIHMQHLCSHWTDFHDIVWKSAKKIQVSLNYKNNNHYFTCRLMWIYDSILLDCT